MRKLDALLMTLAVMSGSILGLWIAEAWQRSRLTCSPEDTLDPHDDQTDANGFSRWQHQMWNAYW